MENKVSYQTEYMRQSPEFKNFINRLSEAKRASVLDTKNAKEEEEYESAIKSKNFFQEKYDF